MSLTVDRFYYTMASLPALSWAAHPHLTKQETWNRLTQETNASDLAVLESAVLVPPRENLQDPSGLIGTWFVWERTLRSELARLRQSRLGFSSTLPIPEDRGMTQFHAASHAVHNENPLAAVRLLNHWRWLAIEDMAQGHWFDLDALTAYWLKYQILEREARFQPEEGAIQLDATHQLIIQALNGRRETQ